MHIYVTSFSNISCYTVKCRTCTFSQYSLVESSNVLFGLGLKVRPDFDQLLLAAHKVHVVYLNQLLDAAH